MKSAMIDKYINKINDAIKDLLPQIENNCEFMNEVMYYSLKNGGKRIRPILVLEFCRLCGGNTEKAMPFAVAIEYIHTYSLIHDDLPCMDNDDMRRGMPSSHVKFGEANALLGGDGLLTRAFGILASADLPPARIVRAVDALSEYAGADGMIGGQYLDLKGENSQLDVNDLRLIDSLKTSALIKCACVLGCIAADAEWEQIDAAEIFAENLGIAFQITDDILDVTSSEQVLGKPVGSDEKNSKNTYVSLLGLENAEKEAIAYTEKAIAALSVFGNAADDLRVFAKDLVNRVC